MRKNKNRIGGQMETKRQTNKGLIIILLLMLFLTINLYSQNRSVSLSSFYIQSEEYYVTLHWITESETNNLGWNIYRSETDNLGDAMQINSVLIPGAGTTTETTEYEFLDEYGVNQGNVYWYWLESLDVSGTTEIYDPISITIPIQVHSFTAHFAGNNVVLCWITETEIDNQGWNIYRGEYEDAFNNGDVMQINSQLIPGYGTTTVPHDYEYTDELEINTGTTYWYWLESLSFSGETLLYGPTSIIIPVAVDNKTITNLETQLFQNHPNPFNPVTTIEFNLKETGFVQVEIFNVKGQFINSLINFNKDTGRHSVIWNGLDTYGNFVSSGLYLYKLKVNGNVLSMRKCLLLK